MVERGRPVRAFVIVSTGRSLAQLGEGCRLVVLSLYGVGKPRKRGQAVPLSR